MDAVLHRGGLYEVDGGKGKRNPAGATPLTVNGQVCLPLYTQHLPLATARLLPSRRPSLLTVQSVPHLSTCHVVYVCY